MNPISEVFVVHMSTTKPQEIEVVGPQEGFVIPPPFLRWGGTEPLPPSRALGTTLGESCPLLKRFTVFYGEALSP